MTPRTGEIELPADAFTNTRLWTRAWAEVVDNLPAWFYFFYGCLLLNAALTNFSPPLIHTTWTVVFPLGVFALFTSVRAFRAPDVESRTLFLLGSLGPALLLPMVTLAWHSPSPVHGDALLYWYELSNFFWAALMLWHAVRARAGHAALFFGAAFFYGAALENGGILLGYFHETKLTLTTVKPLLAPFATMFGWCVVLYMSTFVVWRLRTWLPLLRESNALSAMLVASFATLLDLQIDPLATAAGCWIWDSTLPPFFLGVPLVNFVAWMCALWPFAWLMFRYQQEANIPDGGRWSWKDAAVMTLRGPYALLIAAVCFLISMALLEGLNGPSWSIFFRFGARSLDQLGG